jgi:membrane-bound lytic murein transglycosylase D
MHGVTLGDLIAVNNLDRKATIYVNQNLRIPLPDEKPVLLAELKNPVKDGRSGSQPAENPKPEGAVGSRVTPAGAVTTQATAERSSSDSGLATHPMAVFMLAQRPFSGGLPQSSPTVEAQPAEIEPAAQTSLSDAAGAQTALAGIVPYPALMQGHFAVERVGTHKGRKTGFIRVEAEETLGHYAEWLNVAASDIRRLNGFRYGRPLRLGQQIRIPLERVSPERFEEQRFEFHQELAEDFFASYRVEKVLTYQIQKGDSIWTLSRQEFEVPLWLITRYNADVDFSTLIPSQKLRIPVVEKDV